MQRTRWIQDRISAGTPDWQCEIQVWCCHIVHHHSNMGVLRLGRGKVDVIFNGTKGMRHEQYLDLFEIDEQKNG